MVDSFKVEKNNGVWEINKNDTAYYNFRNEKLLAEMICGELNDLVEENEHLKYELNTLSGLYAFDKLGDGVFAKDDEIIVPRKDLIKLDYSDIE